MSTKIVRVSEFTEGANTTALGVTSDPVWQEFNEAQIDHGAAQRRLGRVKLYQFPVVAQIVDFDGSNDTITMRGSTTIYPLGVRWSLETLFVVDSIASDRFILGRSGSSATSITIKQTTGSTVVVVITDSAAATTTLTWTGIGAATKCALLVTRDGATVTGYLNGVTATATMSATNLLATWGCCLGSDNGGSYLDGAIDFFRIFRTVKTSQRDGWCRLLNPRSEDVMVDYLVDLDANGYCRDRGTLELHSAGTGSPATNRTPLCLNPDPVMAIALNLDTSSQRQGYVVVGASVYPVKL